MRNRKKRAIQMTLVDAAEPVAPIDTPVIDVDSAISTAEKAAVHIVIVGAIAGAGIIAAKTISEIAVNRLSQ